MVLILKQNNEKPPSIQLNSKFYLESIHNIHTTLVKHILLARGDLPAKTGVPGENHRPVPSH